MAGGKTKTSESNKAYFKAYNYEQQKEKKITRHLKKHPNDKQALERPKAKFPEPSGSGWGPWVRVDKDRNK